MDFSFGIDSFEEYWKSVKDTVQAFFDDDLNEDLALSCAHKLWHLCDWYYKENKDRLNYNQLSDLQGEFGRECKSLRVMRDVCNGSKHAEITKTKNPVIKKTKRNKGAFSSAFSRDFDVSVLEVELVDGTTKYFDDAVKEVMTFWLNKVQP